MNQRLYKQRSKKTGLPPGSLVHIGDHVPGPSKISFLAFDETFVEQRDITSIEEVLPLQKAPVTTWINVDSVHNPALLEAIGKAFHLHPLLLEDILNTDQRPKLEIQDDVLYIVLKVANFQEQSQQIKTEQVSLVVGKNYVLTFQEQVGTELNIVREQLKASHTKLRKLGPDYLAYSIIDVIVDHYFIVIEKLGESIESLELKLAERPDKNILQSTHRLRRELILLRKYAWPLREVINTVLRLDSPLLRDNIKPYFRDIYDHTIQIIDTIETYRDILSGLQDLYLSTLSNRMNEVMKVLTVISTIFIPVTFLASIYGMNFEHMPELDSPYGYPLILLIMFSVIVAELVFFKQKKWF